MRLVGSAVGKLRAMFARLENLADLFYSPQKSDPQHPVRSADLSELAEAGLRLPDALVEVLRVQNGGYVRFDGVLGTVAGPDHLYTFERIAGLGDGSNSILKHTRNAGNWGAPAGFVALDGAGHWWMGLDYRQANTDGEPPVAHYDPDSEEITVISNTFAEFRSRLVQADYRLVLAVPANAAEVAKSLGCKKGRTCGHVVEGDLLRFRGSLAPDKPPYLELETNDPRGWGDRFFLSEEIDQPLFFVDVHEEDLGELEQLLIERFGDGTRVVHRPPAPRSRTFRK